MPELCPIAETTTCQEYRARIRAGLADHRTSFTFVEPSNYEMECLNTVLGELNREGWYIHKRDREESIFLTIRLFQTQRQVDEYHETLRLDKERRERFGRNCWITMIVLALTAALIYGVIHVH
jgi:hypothetical protein